MVDYKERAFRRILMELVVCLAISALLSVAAGQDISWDVRNYHLYNAISFFENRSALDFFPADKQTYANPLLDLLYAFLATGPLSHWPRLLAAVMGFWYGLLAFFTLQITRELFPSSFSFEKKIVLPLTLVTALTGAMTFSQIGTTSNDITITVFMLMGLYVALHASEKDKISFILSGFLFGLAAGAKLTATLYMPAFIAALILSFPLSCSLRLSLRFCAGWLVGLTLTLAWWAYRIEGAFDNPFFPLFNNFFKSPLAPPVSLMDTRFLPHGFWQEIAYPFFWAWDKSNHLVYEFDFCDPRMAFAYSALVFLALYQIICFRRREQGQKIPYVSLTQPQKITIWFFVFSYIAWLLTTSLLRYAIILEVLSTLVMAIVLMQSPLSIRKKRTLLILCFVLCLGTTRHEDWEHRDFGDKVFDVDTSWIAPNTLFLGLYEPIGYLAAVIPQTDHVQFVGLPFVKFLHGYSLGDQGQELIASHEGPLVVVFREDRRSFLALLPEFGLSSDVGPCRELKSNFTPRHSPAVMACDVKHA